MMVLKLLASKARYNILTPALALSLTAAPAFAAEVTTPTDDYVITNPDNSLTNSSTITRVSSGDGAVAASVDVDTIYNTVDGQIIGGAVEGINISGNLNTLMNAGLISSTTGSDGVRVSGDVITFSNSGKITGGSYGVNVGGKLTSFNNTGDIFGNGGFGVVVFDDATTFNNSGTILALYSGVRTGKNINSFNNSGTISSTGGGSGFHGSGTVGSFNNSGTISGRRGVFHDDASGMTLVNSGAIIGTGGTAVEFGSGDDTLQLAPGATFTGKVDFDAGANTFDFAAYQGSMILSYATSGTLSNVSGDKLFYDNGTDAVYIVDQESVAQVPFSLSDMSAGISDVVASKLGLASNAPQSLAMGYAATQPESEATTAIDKATTGPDQPQMWSAATFGGSGSIDGQLSSSIYGALVAGTHAQFLPGLTLGIMAGYGRSGANSNTPLQTRTEADIGFVGIYGEQDLDSFTLDFQLLGGISANVSDRGITTATGPVTARGEYLGWFIAPQIGARTNIATLDDGTLIDLSGKVGAVVGGSQGYTETGTVGLLSIGQQTYGIVNASLAVDLQHELQETEAGTIVGTAMMGVFGQAGFGSATEVTIYDATNTAISLGATNASQALVYGLKASFGVDVPLTNDIDLSGTVTAQLANNGRLGGTARAQVSAEF